MKRIQQINKYIITLLVFMLIIGGCAKQGPASNQPETTKIDAKINADQQEAKEDNKEGKEVDTTYPLTIKDSFEREIVIEQEPKRIISIAPSITETIFAIGAGERLVGRTEYCDFPMEVTNIDSIGTISEPSIEKIVELEPDLVLAATHFKQESLEQLEAVGIPVIILYDGNNFEEVYQMIGMIGKVTNQEVVAENVIQGMKDKIQFVMDKVKDQNQPVVYYVVAFGEYGDYTAGGDTFISQMIEMAGGTNAAKEAEGWSYSIEKLVEQDPDIVICSQYFDAKSGIETSNGYKDLTAVKEGRLYEIDNNLLDRQGPRLAEGLEGLAKIIHPDLFK